MSPSMNIEKLRKLREEKGWNKVTAAREMGFTQSVYLRYENGTSKPTLSVIRNLALMLGTSVEYLTDLSDNPAPVEYLVSADDDKF